MMTTLNPNKDENYEISEKVYKTMLNVLSDPLLGDNPTYLPEKFTENKVKTILYCMSLAADYWYAKNSHPRTIFYAVIINTVFEEVGNPEFEPDDRYFWLGLVDKLKKEEENIEKRISEMKNNDKINIDEYHRKIQEVIRC